MHRVELTQEEAEKLHFALHRTSVGCTTTMWEERIPGFYNRAKELSDQLWSAQGDWTDTALHADTHDLWVIYNAATFGNYKLEPIRKRMLELYDPPPEKITAGYGGAMWKRARREALDRADSQCETCGLGQEKHNQEYGTGLHVHHIKPVRTFDKTRNAHAQENLKVLCFDCHTELHPMEEPSHEYKNPHGGTTG